MDSAVLITYDQDDMIGEAVALCESADYKVKHVIKQNFLQKPKYGLSGGKIEDLKEIISTVKPDVIVFDEILKPSQNYNLASELKMEILDREALILQIFEKRSSSAESKLQVKLAQARYDMSRAKEKVRLSKKGEQPGFMGLGTFEVDVYYNEIKKRMINIKSKLVKSGKQRKLHRQARKRLGFKTISLAGYTSAGKTTLISTICGISKFTSGKITLAGHDIVQNYRAARKMIGMVPQELSLESFETVMNTLRFSRGLFGKAPHDSYLEEILEQLSLLDKRNSQILELSGGMKRRLSIAKALSHEPQLLFLDEPTAGVDVELRKDMWVLVRRLRNEGVTVILTTHYIEEAEAIADRVGIIDKGQLLLVEEKGSLMQRLGQKQLTIELQDPLKDLPSKLSDYDIVLAVDRKSLIYTYNMRSGRTGINQILSNLTQSGIIFKDLQTKQSSLEDIFMSLVSETAA